MPTNKILNTARANKRDEFYTLYGDIEAEIKYYEPHFASKVVYCNCDDHKKSNFVKFFIDNFERLKIKALMASHYKEDLFGIFGGGTSSAEIFHYDGVNSTVKPVKGNGDFRGFESESVLKEADIVVSNPPFSLFSEYVTQLAKHKKEFLVLGNVTAITSKELFPLIKENKMWLGMSITGGDREFEVPPDYPLEAYSCRKDETGRRFIKVKGVRWFTNIKNDRLKYILKLNKKYSVSDYPEYENFNAIEVSKTFDIPINYDGYMGVPITFYDKYNPQQFEIFWITDGSENLNPIKKKNAVGYNRAILNGKELFPRLIIKHKK